MSSKPKSPLDNEKPDHITIRVVNKPDKEKSEQIIKELSAFLSKTWHMPINSR